MSVLKPKNFESAEPGFDVRAVKKKSRRQKKSRRHVHPKDKGQMRTMTRRKDHKTFQYKKLYDQVQTIQQYRTFEEWLASLTGSEAPQIRQHAREYRRMHQIHMRMSLSTVALITAYILSEITGASADVGTDVGTDVMVEMCREESIGSVHHYTVNPKAPPSHSMEDLVIAEMRQEGALPMVDQSKPPKLPPRTSERKLLSKKLVDQREKRLPIQSFLEMDKWLQAAFGTLSTDQQRIDRATAECRDLLSQVYDLVDAPLDGANDGDIKRTYMKPILTPVIHDLALHALRADFRFVNATLNDQTEKTQLVRASKIVRELSEVADIPYSKADVKQWVREIQKNPIGWYNNNAPSLIGENIELFIRDITKRYVRRSTDFHKAAIIDASVSGKAIGRRVQNLGETGQLSATLHGTNTQALVIVQHYQQFLNEQLLKTSKHKNKINALLAQSLQSDRTDKIVRDVTLLFSIYDSAAQNAFYDAESRKYSTMSEIFVSFIQKDLRELDAKNRGKEEGMDFLNDLLHGWARELILGTIGILWGISRCRHGHSGNGASEPAKEKAKPPSSDMVRNEECYHIGHNNMLWIREGGEYRRISNHGRKDSHYARGKQTKKVSRTKNAREAGTIDSNGNYN